MFWISVEEYYLANLIHLVRHHVGLQPFMMTSRNDRSGHKDKTTWIAERLSDILSIPEEHRKKEEDDELHLLLHELKTACGRKQPTSLSILVNAQSLIDMAKLRLCKQSSPETIALFNAIKEAVKEIDSDLSEMMVAKCIYRNRLCGEPRCCEYNSTKAFQIELDHYLSFYTNKQKGINERKKA